MPKIRDGFQGQRIVYLPGQARDGMKNNPFSNGLYLQSAGFFPHARHHFVDRPEGCPDYILIYCVEGSGWYQTPAGRFEISEHQYFILPPNMPHQYGANSSSPWTIYWMHFNGSIADTFYQGATAPVSVSPGNFSRIEERLRLFEDMFQNLEMGYSNENLSYASICLNHFLGSLLFINQYRLIRTSETHAHNLSDAAIHFMREHITQNLSLREMAEFLHYSASHFSMVFKQKTGHSPMKYFIQLKMQLACQLLDLSDMKINQVAARTGYDDPHYFTRQFTKEIGMSPQKYRKKAKG